MLENTSNSNADNSFLEPLLIKSAVETDCKLLNEVIANGGNINFQTPKGLDLIMISLAFGNLSGISEYIACLIENGIDINHIDKYYGNNSLQYASRYGLSDVVDLLIKNGIDINSVNNVGYNSLHNACESISLFFSFYISAWEHEMPSLFIQKLSNIVNKGYRSFGGEKYFKLEQEKTISILLENGIDKDCLTHKSLSAMDLAILNNYISDNNIVKLLKKYNVKMNTNITGAKGNLFESLFGGGPEGFYSYCKEDKLIKRKIKEYNRK